MPDATWFNPRRRRLYVAVGKPGVVDVIDTERMLLAQTAVSEVGARTTAFDGDQHLPYAFRPASCAAAVYEDQ